GAWPTWSQAGVRFLALFGPYVGVAYIAGVLRRSNELLGAVFAWAGVAWLASVAWSIATHPERQGWHDRLARTWVIDARKTSFNNRLRQTVRAWQPRPGSQVDTSPA